MKKRIAFFFTVVLFISCEEVIDVDLPTTEPQLVVDAQIGFNQNNGDPLSFGQVTLTLTSPFFAEDTPPAENAVVRLIDEETGASFSLIEDAIGVFNDGFPNLQFDRDYTLEIVYEGEIYRATEQLIPTGTIDSAEQDDGFLFDEEEETEVVITFSDVPDERNYYLFSFGFDNFLVTDDEFYQNSNLTFSYFYEDVEPGDLLTISLLGISKEFATFVDLTLVQSSENGGGPFMVPPATVRGNIVNTTNNSNFAFGFFSISEFDIALVTVQ